MLPIAILSASNRAEVIAIKSEGATLKDIARAMGVSATTVHRALQGKGRVSEQTREKAARLAAEMGYRSNYMAAALKRKSVRFVIALPEPADESRYYYLNLWLGARRFLDTVDEFHLEPQEIYYPLGPDSNGAVLKDIYESGEKIDGIMTIAVKHDQSSYFIEKLAARGIPIALIGADLYKNHRFCCVKSYDEVAGRLGAELLTAFDSGGREKKIILTGNMVGSLTMMDQYDNSRGFEQYIHRHAPGTQLLRAYNSDTGAAYELIKSLLLQHPDTFAIYSCSARHTIQMCRAVTELGLQGHIRLVGNDRFTESNELLRQGVLTAIIDKKIQRQSYLAMRTLFNYKVKGVYPPGSTLFVPPAVVLSSSIETEGAME